MNLNFLESPLKKASTSELHIHKDLSLKIGYGVVGSVVTVLMSIGIWVGTHATRLTNVEARIDRQKEWIQGTIESTDKKLDALTDINTRLSRIEGALGVKAESKK